MQKNYVAFADKKIYLNNKQTHIPLIDLSLLSVEHYVKFLR